MNLFRIKSVRRNLHVKRKATKQKIRIHSNKTMRNVITLIPKISKTIQQRRNANTTFKIINKNNFSYL